MTAATLFSGIGAPEVAMPGTAITYRGKPAADGPRYKAIGNSMAVPVVRWILERLEAVDAIQAESERVA